MKAPSVCFEEDDFTDLQDGYYRGVVDAARYRTSERGNVVVQILYQLPEAPPGCDRVVEYFVVAGSEPRALAISRRRLLGLYRAAGLEPQRGDPIRPNDLVGAHVELRIGHEDWQGQRRLRVFAHRSSS